MIGKVQIITDTRPHCTNGWVETPKYPACNYTGGHFCELLADHEGPCRCTCGSLGPPIPVDDDPYYPLERCARCSGTGLLLLHPEGVPFSQSLAELADCPDCGGDGYHGAAQPRANEVSTRTEEVRPDAVV